MLSSACDVATELWSLSSSQNLLKIRLAKIPGWGAMFKRLSLGAIHS